MNTTHLRRIVHISKPAVDKSLGDNIWRTLFHTFSHYNLLTDWDPQILSPRLLFSFAAEGIADCLQSRRSLRADVADRAAEGAAEPSQLCAVWRADLAKRAAEGIAERSQRAPSCVL